MPNGAEHQYHFALCADRGDAGATSPPPLIAIIYTIQAYVLSIKLDKNKTRGLVFKQDTLTSAILLLCSSQDTHFKEITVEIGDGTGPFRDWDNPPNKDESSNNLTTQVADEAAKFFEYLGLPPAETEETKANSSILLNKLKEWGVNVSLV